MDYCRMILFDQMTRCFICQTYGHIANYYSANIQTYITCASIDKNHGFKYRANCDKSKKTNYPECLACAGVIIQRCKIMHYGLKKSKLDTE
jgi:hypothetical protein